MQKKIIDSLYYRYATKKFDHTKKISNQNLETIFETLRLCPSSFWIQPWKFVFVKDNNIKEELIEHSRWQKQVKESQYQIVFCAKNHIEEKDIDKFIKEQSKLTWVEFDEIKNKRNKIWKIERIFHYFEDSSSIEKEVFIALWFLLEACAILRIDTCPMWWINPKWYDKVLGLENSGYHTVVACALWYRDKNDEYIKQPKVRFNEKDIIQVV